MKVKCSLQTARSSTIHPLSRCVRGVVEQGASFMGKQGTCVMGEQGLV